MLASLRIHNFKTFLNAEFKFQPRHLVIGKNNSGKTNLWQAMRFLGATARFGFQEGAARTVIGGLSELLNWSLESDTLEIACTCEFGSGSSSERYDYALAVRLVDTMPADKPTEAGRQLRVKKESLSFSQGRKAKRLLLVSDGAEAQILDESAKDSESARTSESRAVPTDATMLSKLYDPKANRLAVRFRSHLSTWGGFMLSSEAIKTGWRESSESRVDLAPNGCNLASCLYHLKNFDESGYRRVVKAAQLLEPDLEEINFNTLAGEIPTPFVRLKSRRQASWASLSDGAVRWLAYAYIVELARLTAANDTSRPDLLFVIEEPENGLYPGLMRKLLDMCGETPGAQFIFTSHSPYLINLFDSSRKAVTWLSRNRERTEIRTPSPPDETDPDRLLLAEQFSMDLLS